MRSASNWKPGASGSRRSTTYFGGIAKGATLSGQEYVQLPADVQLAVREEVWRSLGSPHRGAPLVIEMDVLIGSGRRSGSRNRLSGTVRLRSEVWNRRKRHDVAAVFLIRLDHGREGVDCERRWRMALARAMAYPYGAS